MNYWLRTDIDDAIETSQWAVCASITGKWPACGNAAMFAIPIYTRRHGCAAGRQTEAIATKRKGGDDMSHNYRVKSAEEMARLTEQEIPQWLHEFASGRENGYIRVADARLVGDQIQVDIDWQETQDSDWLPGLTLECDRRALVWPLLAKADKQFAAWLASINVWG